VIGFGVVADHLGILVALIGYATFFGLLLTGSGCYAILKRSALPWRPADRLPVRARCDV